MPFSFCAKGGVFLARLSTSSHGGGISSLLRQSVILSTLGRFFRFIGAGLLTLLRGSVFFSAIDRFTQILYNALTGGFFGTLFTAYPTAEEKRESLLFSRPGNSSVRRFITRTVEESVFLHLMRQFIRYLLRCRVRVYGTFFLTFGSYSAASYLLELLGEEKSAPTMTLVVSVVLIGVSLPLLSCNDSLSRALAQSRLAPPILSLLGIRGEALRMEGSAGRSNVAFALGMLVGLCSFFVSPVWITAGMLGIFLAYRVFVTPELGIAALFFGMPFLPTMLLVALVLYIASCFLVKWILGKRQVHLEAVDAAALAFAFSLGCGGLFSFSAGSRKPALVFVCFLGAYFLTVFLIRTGEWLKKCVWAAVASSTLVALYGIFQYFSGALSSANAWLDSDMFEDIAGRAVSTLENPNMLAEYLILLIPLAAAQFLAGKGFSSRTLALLSCGVLGGCIILTWSRGAWLGLLFGVFVFLLIWSRRTIYLIVAGVFSIPFLPFVLPDSIIQRFTSIGNLGDSSTSYRVNIWRGTVRMLEDYWISGVGVGEAAWGTVYPRYSLASIETAPHAHNLYLQTWVQTGIVGLLLLAAFFFLLLQCHFTYYRDLTRMREEISASVLSVHLTSGSRRDAARSIRRTSHEETDVRREITAMRLEAAAPLCGILAALVQGFTDYIWYNYRVYLMFWLICGLSAAYVRSGRAEIERLRGFAFADAEPSSATEAQRTLTIASRTGSSPEKGTSSHA